MELLTRTEEIILLAVFELRDNAYGTTIKGHAEKIVDKKFSIGAIYVPLDRLAAKGYLKTSEGEPTPERGGRSKRFYKLTAKGTTALKNLQKFNEKLWAGFPKTAPLQALFNALTLGDE
jgi:PadR family transcriptional regulator, regulatory protein PadR